MNILVTGGAGFIGSRMAARHLADGHRVVVVDDLSAGPPREGARRRALRPGRHRRRRPRAAAARGEDRFRLAPRRADRPAPQRVGSGLRRARERPRLAEALRGLPPRGRRGASSSRRPAAPSTASPRAAARRPSPIRPTRSLRTAARSSRSRSTSTTTASCTASRRRSSATPTSTARARTGRERPASWRSSREAMLGQPDAQDQRRRRADARLRLRRRPARAAAAARRQATAAAPGTSAPGIETSVNRLFELLAKEFDYTAARPARPGARRRAAAERARRLGDPARLRPAALHAARDGLRAHRRLLPATSHTGARKA